MLRFDLEPGQWYVGLICAKCDEKQILFPDLTEGKARLKATYQWKCPVCGHEGKYDGELLERFQHRPD